MKPKVLVVGSGAVGAFYGGKLAQKGAEVSAVCRSDYDIVKEKGYQIKSVMGDFHFMPAQVVQKAADYTEKADYILVALKSLPEIDRVSLIRDAIHPDAAIVFFQNGIDIERPIAMAFPENEILSALAFVCINRTGPGLIHHLDFGPLILGNFPGELSQKALELGSLFCQAGIQCELTGSIIKGRWRKLVWNAAFNPISVLAGGVDTQQIMAEEETVKLAKNIMEEVCGIAKAIGHELEGKIIEKYLGFTREMKPYKTSMLMDYREKRPLEVEAILGNPVRVAHKVGVPVPHMESLYSLLKLLDQQR